ncbi:rodlin [Streptomyces sp. NBC_01525]|uniref:rodlin n=1 Tax=Streptomyces sp. NBC_01525 TaxID=2903893 RepID=UPI003869F96C
MKKIMAGAAVAVSMLGFSAAAVPQAMAIGNDHGTSTVNGNGAKTAFGNSTTKGEMSPQLELIQGSLNKPCIGMPLKTNVGHLFGFIPIAVQDVNVLSSPQNQQCTENSTQAKGDEPLSHILDDISALSANGEHNS